TQFDAVLAVSARDRDCFRALGAPAVFEIRNGVDLNQYEYAPPSPDGNVVFVGSMDWIANQDAMAHWFESIWPMVVQRCPGATMTIAGRNPSQQLLSLAARSTNIEVTGSVPDVRPYLRRATVSVMPFRIGGGTRMKAYESMASGVPVVSTS